jgi:hypothetical protein
VRGDAEFGVWGSGMPRREFLYVDDLADACVFLMERGYDGPLVNVGTGEDVTIRELAETVMAVVGFRGRIVFDAASPTARRASCSMSVACSALGWAPSHSVESKASRSPTRISFLARSSAAASFPPRRARAAGARAYRAANVWLLFETVTLPQRSVVYTLPTISGFCALFGQSCVSRPDIVASTDRKRELRAEHPPEAPV